tara:strand:+ start:156 stop:383 length:228 start_codon:yes stop_codon:yes gene_type:complete
MPVYTLKNKTTGEEADVNCTYDELQELLESGVCERVWKPNQFITQHGSTFSRCDTDFKSHLKSIKKKYPGSSVHD